MKRNLSNQTAARMAAALNAKAGIRPSDQLIRARIAEIDADERYHYSAANWQINAPLALIQVAMKAEAAALAWALAIKPPRFGPRRKVRT